jgi:hypothetical protein
MPRAIAVAAVVALLAIAATATGQPRHAGNHVQDARCFPARDWGPAPDSTRPCVRLVGLRYSGDVIYDVKDASGAARFGGYIVTSIRRIAAVHIVRVYEDGSFTWRARGKGGHIVTASVGNLQD